MGQQQLLLVILVTILVGIATVVAINVFGTAAEQGNRDAVRQDLLTASAGAQAIWARPPALGGVGGDFSVDPPNDAAFFRLLGIPGSFTAEGGTGEDESVLTNENAAYTLTTRGTNQVVITAEPTTYNNTITLTITRATTTTAADDPWNIQINDGGVITILSGV